MYKQARVGVCIRLIPATFCTRGNHYHRNGHTQWGYKRYIFLGRSSLSHTSALVGSVRWLVIGGLGGRIATLTPLWTPKGTEKGLFWDTNMSKFRPK